MAQQATVMVNGQPEVPAAQQQAVPTPGNPVIVPADVRIPAGTTLAIRINQHISVKTSRAGDPLTARSSSRWSDDNGRVIVPKGTPVGGVVAASHKRGHFKGASILQLAADFDDAEWHAVSAGDEQPDADEEGQGQAVGGVYRRRQRAWHADRRTCYRRDWFADRRSCWRRCGNSGCGSDGEWRYRHPVGVDRSLQAG